MWSGRSGLNYRLASRGDLDLVVGKGVSVCGVGWLSHLGCRLLEDGGVNWPKTTGHILLLGFCVLLFSATHFAFDLL